VDIRLLAAECGVILAAFGLICGIIRAVRGQPLGRVVTSTGLFIFVVLQLGIGLAMVDAVWPITGYPMYAWRPAGDLVVTENLVFSGQTRSGETIEVPDSAVYPDPNDLPQRAIPGLRDPESRDRVAHGLMTYYNAAQPDEEQQLMSLSVAVYVRQWTQDRTLVSSSVEPIATARR